MYDTYGKLVSCLKSVSSRVSFVPKLALVLGSGLGGFAETAEIEDVIEYKDIESFPVSTVPGHEGRFVFAHLGELPVVIMQGRIHYYEGYDVRDVVLPIRLMGLMGAKVLMLTNAVGGINSGFRAGEFMLIRDHILYGVPSPLIGANVEVLGTRFPDMSEVYDDRLCELIKSSATELEIPLHEGVYLQTSGPNFETPAEIRAYKAMGADVVGMSTAVEAVAAKHMGMKVCGVSVISNLAAGISKTPLTHDEVQTAGKIAAPNFTALVTESVKAIGSDGILTNERIFM